MAEAQKTEKKIIPTVFVEGGAEVDQEFELLAARIAAREPEKMSPRLPQQVHKPVIVNRPFRA